MKVSSAERVGVFERQRAVQIRLMREGTSLSASRCHLAEKNSPGSGHLDKVES